MTYIDRTKERKRRLIAAIWAAVLLVVMLVCLYRIEVVCRQQVDTLDQVMELRQEIDTQAVPVMAAQQEIPDPSMTAADFDLICRVIAAESRGEGYEGQLAVAQVIRDRAQLWGLTPAEVVTASGQFATPYQGEISAETMAAVNDCLVLGKSAFDGAVTHFCEINITPYWAEDKEVAGVVGNHRFYR